MRYPIEPKDRRYVKRYVVSIAKNLLKVLKSLQQMQ